MEAKAETESSHWESAQHVPGKPWKSAQTLPIKILIRHSCSPVPPLKESSIFLLRRQIFSTYFSLFSLHPPDSGFFLGGRHSKDLLQYGSTLLALQGVLNV
jgi:hypothetical protein